MELNKFLREQKWDRIFLRLMFWCLVSVFILSAGSVIMAWSISGKSFINFIDLIAINIIFILVAIVIKFIQNDQKTRQLQNLNIFKEIGPFSIVSVIVGFRYIGKERTYLVFSKEEDLFEVLCNENGDVQINPIASHQSFKFNSVHPAKNS